MSEEPSQWSSHLPALLAACEHTTGTVIECGMGDGSTPVLHDLCARMGRVLWSYDHDPAWVDKFRHFETDSHHMMVVAWAQIYDRRLPEMARLVADDIGVAFIDHGVAPRGPLVDVVRRHAQVVVMHDSECAYTGYTEPLGRFDWVWTQRNGPAWTTLAGLGQRPGWVETLQPGISGIPVPYR